MKTEKQIILQQKPYTLHQLYDRYSGMLLGYISEIVGDTELAEKYLISFYSQIPDHINGITRNEVNTWCQLQYLAKRHLKLFDKATKDYQLTPPDTKYNDRNKFLALMSCDQKHVFCNIYYGGKTISQLSKELNKSEELIRVSLREAFKVIKKR